MERVESVTNPKINEKIRQGIEDSIRYFAQNPTQIGERLIELDKEWDIERALQANASILILSGLLLSKLCNRKWVLLSSMVSGFLLQHAVQGWCPPIPLFRRLGIRTRDEILYEKTALLAIRGEFEKIIGSLEDKGILASRMISGNA